MVILDRELTIERVIASLNPLRHDAPFVLLILNIGNSHEHISHDLRQRTRLPSLDQLFHIRYPDKTPKR